MAKTSQPTRAPNKALYLTDYARSAWDIGALSATLPALARAPRGDGHAVLVIDLRQEGSSWDGQRDYANGSLGSPEARPWNSDPAGGRHNIGGADLCNRHRSGIGAKQLLTAYVALSRLKATP